MIVQKCCCCCSLKYGFYTWGIINLLARVCGAAVAYFGNFTITHSGKSHNTLGGAMFGWFLATALIVVLGLKGIVEKRYMLIYPYIVVLVLEVLVFLATTIYLAIVSSPWHILELFVVGIINTYTIICLVSLYQHVKQLQKSQLQMEGIPFKTV